MPGLATVFRAGAEEYERKHGERMLPSHRRAMSDIIRCRSPEMEHGGIYECSCGRRHYSYHSCGNRNCPKCGNEKVTGWLGRRLAERPPVEHYLVTFPLPSEFRPLCRHEQRSMSDAAFRASSGALSELMLDRRFVGGRPGMIGFHQTWRRDMGWHPHIHYIVPGGGISPDGRRWIYPKKKGFLVHGDPLAALFRGKFKAEMGKMGFTGKIDPAVWKKKWVVDCCSAGNGAGAYRYLAAYTQRTAITDNRIKDVSGGRVTYSYVESESKREKLLSVPILAFMALFLQHVPPRGFVRTRYYGFMAPAAKCTLRKILLLLVSARNSPPQENKITEGKLPKCPSCGQIMQFAGVWRSVRGPPE